MERVRFYHLFGAFTRPSLFPPLDATLAARRKDKHADMADPRPFRTVFAMRIRERPRLLTSFHPKSKQRDRCVRS
jgi:hypothetical protein